MAKYKLKYLNIPMLVDAALQCGINREPIHLYIAADPGSGKTWGTQSLEHEQGVNYFCANYTPNEYKIYIDAIKRTTKLFIHDDVGRIANMYCNDFISAFCDLTEGHTEFRQYKKSLTSDFSFSTVFTSTLGWCNAWRDMMKEKGFFDRVLVVKLELSEETRSLYQFQMQESADAGALSNRPSARKPVFREMHEPVNAYGKYDIDPRNLRNILRISKYLSVNEMDELVKVIQSDRVEYCI